MLKDNIFNLKLIFVFEVLDSSWKKGGLTPKYKKNEEQLEVTSHLSNKYHFYTSKTKQRSAPKKSNPYQQSIPNKHIIQKIIQGA